MPSQNEIVRAIEGIVREQLNVPRAAGALGPATPLFDGGLELDSFSVIQLMAALEEQFSFVFQEDDYQEEHFRTIGSLSRLIAQYLDGARPS